MHVTAFYIGRSIILPMFFHLVALARQDGYGHGSAASTTPLLIPLNEGVIIFCHHSRIRRMA